MNILITGASKGIGEQMVNIAAANGNKIVAIARNSVLLKTIADRNNKVHPQSKVYPIAADLTNMSADNILVEINKYLDSVDVLINNAGAIVNKPFNEITAKNLQEVFSVNVFSPFFLIQSLLPFLKKSHQAHVVNIGSMGGYQGSAKFKGLSAYSSSKGALAILSECLAEELKSDKIAVNCLCLGAVQTEMLEKAFPGYKAPLSANKMADFIYKFAVNNATFINGKVIPVSLSTP
jgi:short-subunit dehydrogenase